MAASKNHGWIQRGGGGGGGGGGGEGGDRGSRSHLKNHKNIGFLINTGANPLKNTKLSSKHSMLGHHRHASETPFKCLSE